MRPASYGIAQAGHLIDRPVLKLGEDRIERNAVAVDIGENGDPHPPNAHSRCMRVTNVINDRVRVLARHCLSQLGAGSSPDARPHGRR